MLGPDAPHGRSWRGKTADMHLHTEVAVHADSRDDALTQAEQLLIRYKDELGWDWWQIGGRWRGIHTGDIIRGDGDFATQWDAHQADVARADAVDGDGALRAALVITENGVEGQEGSETIPVPAGSGLWLVTVDIHV